MNEIQVQVLDSIRQVGDSEWNALVRGDCPFLQHAFMAALEDNDCVGEASGWIPRHLVYRVGDDLVGALPLYEKHNSWGEFVFDHAWAHAYERYGLPYYPKLVNAIPFTPASGQRVLAAPGDTDTVRILVQAARTFALEHGYSGIHCLFPSPKDFELLDQQRAHSRNDCQFHWHNRDYGDFEHFLAALRHKKRKNIRQERRKVADSGVTVHWLDGHSASEDDWRDFVRLYRLIYNRKYGMPAFNLGFFTDIAQCMPGHILLALARDDGRAVAGALMYRDRDTLYGRHWGCDGYVDSLHFELCYYRGIEYCIEQGIGKFDPGAQGEHKVARGFEPTLTRSLHWLSDSPFHQAIGDFVSREQLGVQHYIDAVRDHSPYNR